MSEQRFTIAEAAKMMAIPGGTVHGWASRGEISVEVIDGQKRVLLNEVAERAKTRKARQSAKAREAEVVDVGESDGALVELTAVSFHGDTMQAVKDGDRVLVSIRRVSENLGVDYPGQLRNLKARAEHGCKWATVDIMSTVGADARDRMHAMIDLDGLPMWLANIEPSRVSADVRARLVRYQDEAAKVLRNHFFGESPVVVDGDPLLAQIAVLQSMRQQQLVADRRLALVESAVEKAARREAEVRQEVEETRKVAEKAAAEIPKAIDEAVSDLKAGARAHLDAITGRFGLDLLQNRKTLDGLANDVSSKVLGKKGLARAFFGIAKGACLKTALVAMDLCGHRISNRPNPPGAKTILFDRLKTVEEWRDAEAILLAMLKSEDLSWLDQGAEYAWARNNLPQKRTAQGLLGADFAKACA